MAAAVTKEGSAGIVPLLQSAATGVLLALSLPPFDQEWLSWVALAPLFAASLRRRPLEAVGLGMIAGLTCGALLVPLDPRAHGFIFALFPFLMLALLLGLGALAAGWARCRSAGVRWTVFLACTGLLLEWVTLAGPMPLQLALCQWRNLGLIQIASITGIWGVSFLLWLANAAVADLLISRRWNTPTVGLLFVPLAAWLLGIGLTPRGNPPKLHVAAVQTYSGQEGSSYLPHGVTAVEPGDPEQMTRAAAARGARLIIWPELGASFSPDAPEDPATLLARQLKVGLVVGYPEPGTPKGYNCAAVIDPAGQVRGVHRKNYPFLGERRDTNAGTAATAFDTELGRLGVAICFDTCYPELPRRLARSGAQLIAMPNYDPVAPGGLVHRLHGAVLPFRAVENRFPIIRCDANGMSQVIDATGRVLAQGGFFHPEVVDAEVGLGDGQGTFFSRFGDWLPFVCLLIVCLTGVEFRRSALPRR